MLSRGQDDIGPSPMLFMGLQAVRFHNTTHSSLRQVGSSVRSTRKINCLCKPWGATKGVWVQWNGALKVLEYDQWPLPVLQVPASASLYREVREEWLDMAEVVRYLSCKVYQGDKDASADCDPRTPCGGPPEPSASI